MKYKVGDKVRIKSIDWYNSNKNKYGIIENCRFVEPMSANCGKEATILGFISDGYILDIDESYVWRDEMFDENFNNMKTKKIIIPKGWEIDKVKNGEIILKESKKELPKTWEGCYKQLGCGEFVDNICDINGSKLICPTSINRNALPFGLGKPVLALCQLLVCRAVYRQGWKPDWKITNEKYCIIQIEGKITTLNNQVISRVLSFQSEEVRDKFLGNFRDLIEEAKELI